MIKAVTVVQQTSTPAEFDQLAGFFSALGFEKGKGWETNDGRGSSFLAPLGNLEFVLGSLPASSTILIEVTSLDSVREVASRWLKQNTTASRISEISETDWNSRLFTVELLPAASFTFWESLDPLKGKPIALEGDLSAEGMRFAIVVSRWNAVITDRLLQGALDALLRSGARKENVRILRVPGAWEIPSAARKAAESGNFDAIITLGVLLRGETAHYEAIYNEVARGIGQSQQETGIPHTFGVLTCETLEQALDRAGLKMGNKGFEAAAAAIEMVSLHRKLETGAAAK
jgi:6,7-dimethyl-8-ribityllumazine synthase